MTKEEAIDVLKKTLAYESDFAEAKRMAIEALQAEQIGTEFVNWLMEEVLDDDNWALNAVALGEVICRKLKKLGLLEVKDGYYIRPSDEISTNQKKHQLSAETPTNEPTDLISRRQVHKTLSLLATEGGTDAKMLLSDAHEFIDALPSAEADWTPCSERLPEDLQKAITCNKHGEMMIGTYTEWGWMFPCYFEKPIAWLPLPTSYKGGESDEID